MSTTTIRIQRSHFERAEKLVALMKGGPEMVAMTKPTAAAILRVAIEQGLKDFEAKYGGQSAKGKKR